jgi:NAD(P)-dependent dehydrogenase (short-subunit alcohol dehydrogenase family)
LSAIGALQNDTHTPEKKLSQLHMDHFLWSYECNALSHAMILKHIAPKMNKKEPSMMGFLSARVGSIGDNQLGGWYAYRAAKAALNMIIKTAAIEMKRYNKHLSIIGIHPGTVDTELSKPFQSHVPQHKLFTPDQSVGYIFDNIIGKVTVEDSGHVFAWDGKKIPE